MLAAAKNYDIICFQLKNHYFDQLDNGFQKQVNDFISCMESILTSEHAIKPALTKSLKDIFALRIKAVKWLLEEGELNLDHAMEEVYPAFESITQNPHLSILAENVLFALRCNTRVIDSIIAEDENPSVSNITQGLADLPALTYDQFVAAIALGIPGDYDAQNTLDMANASLYIEAVLIATDMIANQNIKVSEKAIDELSQIVSEAAQDYSAIAREIGLFGKRKPVTNIHLSYDEEFVSQEKLMADLGLGDLTSL